MAALTWRSVAAPDFSGVQGGISNAGDFFNKAFSGGQKVLGDVQELREDAVIKDVLGRAMASNDPAAIQAMAGEASLNRDMTLKGMERLNNQVDATQRRNMTSERFAREKIDWGRTDEHRAAQKAVTPVIAAGLARGDSPQAILKSMSETPGAEGLGINDLTNIFSTFASNRNSEFAYNRDVTSWGQSQDDRQAGIDAENFVANTPILDAYSGRQAVAEAVKSGQLSPNAARYVARKYGFDAPAFDTQTGLPHGMPAGGDGGMSVTPGMSIGGASLGTRTDNPQGIMNYEARGRGYASVPDSALSSYNELDKYGTQVINTGKKGVASSASGYFQITRDTRREFGEKALGSNWKSLPATVENDAKIAQEIYKSTGKDIKALRGRWTILKKVSDADIRKITALPDDQAVRIIGSMDSGASPDALRVDQAGVNASRNAQRAKEDVGNTAAIMREFSGDETSQSAVLADLKESIPGATERDLNRILTKIVSEGGVKFKVAGELMKNNIKNTGFWGFFDILNSDAVSNDKGIGIKVKEILAEIKKAPNTVEDQAVVNTARALEESRLGQARAAYEAADQALIAATNTAQARGIPDSQLAPYRQRRDQAKALWDELLKSDSARPEPIQPAAVAAPRAIARAPAKPTQGKPVARSGVNAPLKRGTVTNDVWAQALGWK